MHNRIQTPVWAAITALGIALMVGGLTSPIVHSSTEEPSYTVASETRMPVVFEQGFSPVVRSSAPSVVNISSSRIVRSPEGVPDAPFLNDPFLRRFLGPDFMRQFRVPRERREHSLGSGVIVNSAGYLLTNNHVIEGATDIKVVLSDNREMEGKIVGTDPGTDIAVVKIPTDHLAVLPFADSSKVEVGDIALAIGNSFGLGRTVTMGIVSATGRGGLGIEDYEDFIQTDASINPGNSGGALVNVRGELIGINTAILSRSGGNQGIGFAIPANMAREVMRSLREKGRVVRGYIGASVQTLTPELAEAMKFKGQPTGALVGEVTPKSPSEKAGMKTGDVITAVNGKKISDARELRLMIGSMAPGTKVQIEVNREGQSKIFNVELAEMPPGEAEQGAETSPEESAQPEKATVFGGVAVADVTDEIRNALNLSKDVKGAVIAEIDADSPAAKAGLREGDVIQEVNKQPVRNAKDLVAISKKLKPNEKILIRVWSQGRSGFVALEPK